DGSSCNDEDQHDEQKRCEHDEEHGVAEPGEQPPHASSPAARPGRARNIHAGRSRTPKGQPGRSRMSSNPSPRISWRSPRYSASSCFASSGATGGGFSRKYSPYAPSISSPHAWIRATRSAGSSSSTSGRSSPSVSADQSSSTE